MKTPGPCRAGARAPVVPVVPVARVALVALAMLGAVAPARAERADRGKPMTIDADHQTLDDLNQVSVFTGAVVLTKGTLRLTGDRVEYREDPEGYQHAVVTVAPGGHATFNERRDAERPGIDETVGGEADRVEYDGKLDTVRLVSNAVVRRYENGVQRDEISGALIVYDGINSTYDVRAADAADAGRGATRVHSVLAPRNAGAVAGAAPPAAVKLEPTVPPAMRQERQP